jgi:hypothetical protein
MFKPNSRDHSLESAVFRFARYLGDKLPSSKRYTTVTEMTRGVGIITGERNS